MTILETYTSPKNAAPPSLDRIKAKIAGKTLGELLAMRGDLAEQISHFDPASVANAHPALAAHAVRTKDAAHVDHKPVDPQPRGVTYSAPNEWHAANPTDGLNRDSEMARRTRLQAEFAYISEYIASGMAKS